MKSTYVPFNEKMEEVAVSYLKFCKSGALLDGVKLEKVDDPKISIVIPMYNEAKHLGLALRSIQNQSLREIEIICVNDNSTDETPKLLSQYVKEDPRIKVIKNPKNRGVLYNRIFGALNSKGEYITFVDADDGYCQMNLLRNIYNAAKERNKPEIVHFHTCGSTFDGENNFDKLYLFFTYNPGVFGKVFNQPEIRDNYLQKKKHLTGSGLVYDKLYSKRLIQDVADYIGEDIWNQHLVFCDDLLLCFAAMRRAQSFVMIDEIGYWHWFDNASSMTTSVFEIDGPNLKNPTKSNKKILDYILVKEKIFDLTEDDKETLEIRESILRDLESNEYFRGVVRSIHFQRLLTLYERFINWKYTTKEAKIRVIGGMEKFLEASVALKDKYAKYINQLYGF